MGRTKKTLLPRNLNTYDVFIEDRTPTSEYFAVSNLPSMFTGGRNSFVINGNLALLEERSEVLIEILDANKNTVAFFPVKNYKESLGTLISVEVYETTAVGIGTIILMGKAARVSTGDSIPEIWKNKFNVRWAKSILIDSNVPNASPLRFIRQPTAIVTERILRQAITASYDTVTDSITASLSPILSNGVLSGYLMQAVPPTQFKSEHLTGNITGSMIINNVSASVSLPISSILNSSVAFSTDNFITLGTQKLRNIYIQNGTYVGAVNNIDASITAAVALQYSALSATTRGIDASYASLRVSNLTTVSGEVHKLRIYARPAASLAEYKLVGDVKLAASEILFTPTVYGEYPIGVFSDTSSAQLFWYAGPLEKNQDITAATFPVSGSSAYYMPPTESPFELTVSSAVLLDSIQASINVVQNKFAGAVSESGYFIGTKPPVTLLRNTEYTLSFDAYYLSRSGSVILEGNPPQLDIYLLGQTVNQNPLGQRIGTLLPDAQSYWYPKQQFNFYIEDGVSSSTSLRFVIRNGFWSFSNISIKPATDKLFAPDETSILVPNTEYTKDILEYKIEFFDINNNSADVRATSIPTFFTGSYIDLGTLPSTV